MKYLVILSWLQDHTEPNLNTGDDDRWTTTETKVLVETENKTQAIEFMEAYEFPSNIWDQVNESAFVYITYGKTAKGLNTFELQRKRFLEKKKNE